uniref:Sucrose transport protein SUC4 isoform X3 n=1 Tax=Rhizophora mucronata TaxID=61149 RepID=A0A2P2LY46_RHIMU
MSPSRFPHQHNSYSLLATKHNSLYLLTNSGTKCKRFQPILLGQLDHQWAIETAL